MPKATSQKGANPVTRRDCLRGGLVLGAAAWFTPGVFAWGLAFALGVAVIGALYPAWRAVRLTPIEALRRE